MKTGLYRHTDFRPRPRPRPRPWLDAFARGLIERGTHARRLLEADLDGWSTGDALGIWDESERLERRIRLLFAGSARPALAPAALSVGLFARGRFWS